MSHSLPHFSNPLTIYSSFLVISPPAATPITVDVAVNTLPPKYCSFPITPMVAQTTNTAVVHPSPLLPLLVVAILPGYSSHHCLWTNTGHPLNKIKKIPLLSSSNKIPPRSSPHFFYLSCRDRATTLLCFSLSVRSICLYVILKVVPHFQ